MKITPTPELPVLTPPIPTFKIIQNLKKVFGDYTSPHGITRDFVTMLSMIRFFVIKPMLYVIKFVFGVTIYNRLFVTICNQVVNVCYL